MANEKKQEKLSTGERYERVWQLMKEGKLRTSTGELSIGISAEVLKSLKATSKGRESNK